MGVTLEATESNRNQPREDALFPRNGYDIVVEKTVLEKVGKIRIHYRPNQYIGMEMRVTPA